MKSEKFTIRIILFVTTACIVAACGDGRKAVNREDDEDVTDGDQQVAMNDAGELPQGAEVLFDDFFFNFATNERLQRSRIHFPLTVEGGAGRDEQIADSAWQPDRFFFDSGEYTMIVSSQEQLAVVTDTTVRSAMVEKFFLAADSVSQYCFNKRDGKWTLDAMRVGRVSGHPDASFLKFYHRFCTDSAFRQRSLAQEIAFTSQDPDDDFSKMKGFITTDSWDAFAPELPQDTIYNIVYGTPPHEETHQRIFIIRGIDDEEDIELTFNNERGKWELTELTE
jgi:hypothetical protein